MIICAIMKDRMNFQMDVNAMGEKILKCPQCGYPQHCGCPACISRIPEGILPYVWDETGELISCAKCGYTLHADGWLIISELMVDDQ